MILARVAPTRPQPRISSLIFPSSPADGRSVSFMRPATENPCSHRHLAPANYTWDSKSFATVRQLRYHAGISSWPYQLYLGQPEAAHYSVNVTAYSMPIIAPCHRTKLPPHPAGP